MLGKINKHSLVHGFHKPKQLIYRSCIRKDKELLNDVDHGVRIFIKVYAAISPLLDQYGVNSINKHVMTTINGYDTIRHKVLDSHDEISDNLHKTKRNLDKNNVKICIRLKIFR